MELDLASIKSIKNFVEELKLTYTEIHILINNAGVSYPISAKQKTKDGFEINMGTNHLGHFLLTNLLLDQLKCAPSSRIIIVSSLLHEKGKLHLDNLNLTKLKTKSNAYANSKLANIYFCNELAKKTQGTNVKVCAVCPGWVYTNLFRHNNFKWYYAILLVPVAFFFMRTPKQVMIHFIY